MSTVAVTTNEQLKDFLKQKMSFQDFDNLDTILNTSPHMITKYMNNPKRIPFSDLVVIAKLAGVDASMLYTDFEAGADEMTPAEINIILKKEAAV